MDKRNWGKLPVGTKLNVRVGLGGILILERESDNACIMTTGEGLQLENNNNELEITVLHGNEKLPLGLKACPDPLDDVLRHDGKGNIVPKLDHSGIDLNKVFSGVLPDRTPNPSQTTAEQKREAYLRLKAIDDRLAEDGLKWPFGKIPNTTLPLKGAITFGCVDDEATKPVYSFDKDPMPETEDDGE